MQRIEDRLRDYMPFFDDGNWELDDPPRVLGEGSSGVVFQIWNGKVDAALKVISIPKNDLQAQKWMREAGGTREGLQKRIEEEFGYVKAEIETMEALKPDNNIVCFEKAREIAYTDAELGVNMYLVFIRMERLITLQQFFENINKYPHKRDLRLVLTIWNQLLLGLSRCERAHVFHLDIKPENIFYAEPSKDYFKLGDFGVSIRNEMGATAAEGTRVGTEDYMAPEIYDFKGGDARTDMYSLAVVIYELLNKGRLPFMDPNEENTPEARRKARRRRLSGKERIPPIKGVDAALMRILLKCLSPNPAERYPNMQSMQIVVNAYLNDLVSKNVRSGGKSRKLLITIGAAGTAGLVLMIMLLLLSNPAEPTLQPTQMLPTAAPTAMLPTEAPTAVPTAVPTEAPTAIPTEAPTAIPTAAPTAMLPTEAPTAVPTAASTEAPTAIPTEAPTAIPTEAPTVVPTEAPTEVPATPSPIPAPTHIEVWVASGLTEDEPQLLLDSSAGVNVSLYYFKKGEEILLTPEYKADELRVDGRTSWNLSAGRLTEGDVCVAVYSDENGATQQLPITVGASRRMQLDIQIDDLYIADGQMYPIVRGDTLSGVIVGKSKDFVLRTLRTPDADDDEGSEVTVQLTQSGESAFEFYAEDCDIDANGAVVTIGAAYPDGLGVSRWKTMRVLWTTDASVALAWQPIMAGDREIRFTTDPGAAITVYCNGQQVGETAFADAQGSCVWTGDPELSIDDTIAVHAEDAFGNGRDALLSAQKYKAWIENAQDGRVLRDTVSLAGNARPDSDVQVVFVSESDERTIVVENVHTDAADGAYRVSIDAQHIEGLGDEMRMCRFEIGSEADGYVVTESIYWRPRVLLRLSPILTEDSDALIIQSEPGAQITVSKNDGTVHFLFADANGECRFVPENGFELGAPYTVTAQDADPENANRANTASIAVRSAERARITAHVTNAVAMAKQDLSVVQDDTLIITGTADPNRMITVCWNAASPIVETVQTDAEGAFTGILPMDDGITEEGVTANVTVSYADGKAADCAAETDSVIWTRDHSVRLEVNPIMNNSKKLTVHTDAHADVNITCDGAVIAQGTADAQGTLICDVPDAFAAGDVVRVECEDVFENRASKDVEVLQFSLRVDGIREGELRKANMQIVGVAQPNADVVVRLFATEYEGEIAAQTVRTDASGAYTALWTRDLYEVEGRGLYVAVDCGEERVGTSPFTWYPSVQIQAYPSELTETDVEGIFIAEPGAWITVEHTNGVLYDDYIPKDGFRLEQEGGFICGDHYYVKIYDPQDAERYGFKWDRIVEEVDRPDITVQLLNADAFSDVPTGSIVRGNAVRVSGNAQPGAEIAAMWMPDYQSGADEVYAIADADGIYSIVINQNDKMGQTGMEGCVQVRYADGKAQSRTGFCDPFYWTEDDSIHLTLGELFDRDAQLSITVDANAVCKIYRDAKALRDGNWYTLQDGTLYYVFDREVRTDEVYTVVARDRFGNETEATVRVAADPFAPIRAKVDPANGINAATRSLIIQGTAEPNAQVRLKINTKWTELIPVAEDGTFTADIDVDAYTGNMDTECVIRAEYSDGHKSRALEPIRILVDRHVPDLDVDVSGIGVRSTQISGRTEPGAKVRLSIGNQHWETTAEQGSFTFSGLTLVENDFIQIWAWDSAGNYSETIQTVIGKQEAASIQAKVFGGDLYVYGWVVCERVSELKFEIGGKSLLVKSNPVDAAMLAADLNRYEQRVGTHVNTQGKQCIRIEQIIDIGKLASGTYELRLFMDDFLDPRLLDSCVFEKQTDAMVVPNTPVIDEDDYAFAFGLDDVRAMNAGGILLTGWYYGGTEYDAYILSDVRLLETYADAETMAADEILRQTDGLEMKLSPEGDLLQGYQKLPRRDVKSCLPSAYRTPLAQVAPVEKNAGFMVWLDSWKDLKDGDYKVVVEIQCGGKMMYPSAQLSIRGGEPVITGAQMRGIAEDWAPAS